MKPSKKLIEKILSDNDFSLDIAKAVKDTTQYAIIIRAKRYSKLLLLAPFVEVYKAYGLSEEDIYAKEEENDSGDCIDRVQGAKWGGKGTLPKALGARDDSQAPHSEKTETESVGRCRDCGEAGGAL